MSYALATTDLLERTLAGARDLPAEMQGELTRLVLAYAGDAPPAIPPAAGDARRMRAADARQADARTPPAR